MKNHVLAKSVGSQYGDQFNIAFRCGNLVRSFRAKFIPGGGVFPYLGYTGTCRWTGYGFLASLS